VALQKGKKTRNKIGGEYFTWLVAYKSAFDCGPGKGIPWREEGEGKKKNLHKIGVPHSLRSHGT